MGAFERYLSVWVALAIAGGIALGQVLPGVFEALAEALRRHPGHALVQANAANALVALVAGAEENACRMLSLDGVVEAVRAARDRAGATPTSNEAAHCATLLEQVLEACGE